MTSDDDVDHDDVAAASSSSRRTEAMMRSWLRSRTEGGTIDQTKSMMMMTTTTTKDIGRRRPVSEGGDEDLAQGRSTASSVRAAVAVSATVSGAASVDPGRTSPFPRGDGTSFDGESSEEMTTWNGRGEDEGAAMVSLSLSEIKSADENDDDDPTRVEEECGIGHHPQRGDARVEHRTNETIDRSIFVCITEMPHRADVSPTTTPQCNGVDEIDGLERKGGFCAAEGRSWNGIGMTSTAEKLRRESEECLRVVEIESDDFFTKEINAQVAVMEERELLQEEPFSRMDECKREDRNKYDGVTGDRVTDRMQPTETGSSIPFYTGKERSTNGNAANVLAGKLRWEAKENLRVEEIDNDDFLMEEDNVRVAIMEDRELLHETQMNELDDRLASSETAANHVAKDIEVEVIMDMEGLSRDDETSPSGIIFGESPNAGPRSPSFGSMSLNASIDGSQSAHSEVEDLLTVRNEYASSNQPVDRPLRAPTLSECLAAVQEYLLDSPDGISEVIDEPNLTDPFARLFSHDRKSDVVEDPSPRDQLVFNYPFHSGAGDETSQCSDVDSNESCKSELGRAKSELNTLIDEISALEDATRIQHDYITSPTNHDLHTQLNNLNSQIDGIIPPLGVSPRREKTSVTKIGSSTKILAGTISAQKLYFYKQPKLSNLSDHPKKQGRPAVKEVEVDGSPVDRLTSNTSQTQKKDTSVITPATKKLTVIPNNTKTPGRSKQIASIREKLHVLTDPTDLSSTRNVAAENISNGTGTRSPAFGRPLVSAAITPTIKLIDLPSLTKSSARKCYFYKSPRSDETTKRPVRADGASGEHRPPHPSGVLEGETRSSDCARGGKMTFAKPSISPREAMALRRHILRGTRGKRSGIDAEDGVGGESRRRGGDGSPIPPQRFATTTASPREAMAHERQIRGMRERLNDKGRPTAGNALLPDGVPRATVESAYDRHVRRIQGRPRTA
ncbi:hypothetical protein ACHAW5_003432 [Stephanodiscus triporus]|uniref:Uncharacterized protein n=1 Tax=Stephanodiscus triporus TaxID=2934178 RepID=A0ABD3NQI0_9STRA